MTIFWTDKQLKDLKSEEIRCGTITFSDISQAKKEGNSRSTTNNENDDVEKLNNFKKYEKVPKEKEKYRYSHSRDQEQNLPVSCQGQECEWIGFTIYGFVMFMVLFLFAYFGIF